MHILRVLTIPTYRVYRLYEESTDSYEESTDSMIVHSHRWYMVVTYGRVMRGNYSCYTIALRRI